MLKKLEKGDVNALYTHLLNPNLLYIRYRSESLEEYYHIIQDLIEKEEKAEAIVRVILNEEGQPIGQIALFDIEGSTGFLSTWIAEAYQGKGINQRAKDAFLAELFEEKAMRTIYAKIRKTNLRSLNAAAKIPYMLHANKTNPNIYQWINQNEECYDLFEIKAQSFNAYNADKKT